MSFEQSKEQKNIPPEPYEKEVSGEKFVFERYSVTEHDLTEAPMGIMPADQETIEQYHHLDLVHKIVPGIPVPFVFLKKEGSRNFGNYTTKEGQQEFYDSEAVALDETFNPPPEIAELWEFSQMMPRQFPFDKTLTGLRKLETRGGKLNFGLAPCQYSRFFYTNRAEAVNLSLSDSEKEKWLKVLGENAFTDLLKKSEELQGKYPQARTIGEVIRSKYPDLPDFNERVRGDVIGVAGMVLTRDGKFVFVNRGKNVAVNWGINCTASGSADFDKDLLSREGLQTFIGTQMDRESREELGFKSSNLLIHGMTRRIEIELGLSPSDFSLMPVGFLRELRQGASPEAMFLIKFAGDVQDVLAAIRNNKHEEGREIDQFVYALDQEDTQRLITTPGANTIVQNKGLVNLMLIMEFLKNVSPE